MSLVAGVDCSTQNTKVVVCDAETGEVVREGRAPHPDVTEVDARVWWQAWEQASADLLEDVSAVAVGGQQHGMVLVDEAGTPVRDALLWNDNRSAPSTRLNSRTTRLDPDSTRSATARVRPSGETARAM